VRPLLPFALPAPRVQAGDDARLTGTPLGPLCHWERSSIGIMDKPLQPRCPAGTIISCPDCGEGLYKVTHSATPRELVLDTGTLLIPLNRTIPSRAVWQRLICPCCNGRLFHKGRIHTLQQGWV
jgi:hypothetical protein